MGSFSWITCDTKERIINGEEINVYVLVPEEFGGDNIKESCYGGYGIFGEKDIYDLVAIWNKDFLEEIFNSTNRKHRKDPIIEEIALIYKEKTEKDVLKYIEDHNLPDIYKYSWLRFIGIYLACYDEDNAQLPYPIKIAKSEYAVYEDCDPSPGDPYQGFKDYI